MDGRTVGTLVMFFWQVCPNGFEATVCALDFTGCPWVVDGRKKVALGKLVDLDDTNKKQHSCQQECMQQVT